MTPHRWAAAVPRADLLALPAQAQPAWPTKPVRILVGFSAGGPTDVVARAFADHASRTLGQPFVVDNKPGANTILAAEAVAAAPADGYTLLLGATNHTMIPALYSQRVKFDAVRSFAPVCSRRRQPDGAGRRAVDAGQVARATFLKAVKAAPGKRTYGTPGVGQFGPLRERAVHAADRHLDEPHSVQGRRAGHDRPDGRTGRQFVRDAGLGAAAGAGAAS